MEKYSEKSDSRIERSEPQDAGGGELVVDLWQSREKELQQRNTSPSGKQEPATAVLPALELVDYSQDQSSVEQGKYSNIDPESTWKMLSEKYRKVHGEGSRNNDPNLQTRFQIDDARWVSGKVSPEYRKEQLFPTPKGVIAVDPETGRSRRIDNDEGRNRGILEVQPGRPHGDHTR